MIPHPVFFSSLITSLEIKGMYGKNNHGIRDAVNCILGLFDVS
jgi:hypothetical protein